MKLLLILCITLVGCTPPPTEHEPVTFTTPSIVVAKEYKPAEGGFLSSQDAEKFILRTCPKTTPKCEWARSTEVDSQTWHSIKLGDSYDVPK